MLANTLPQNSLLVASGLCTLRSCLPRSILLRSKLGILKHFLGFHLDRLPLRLRSVRLSLRSPCVCDGLSLRGLCLPCCDSMRLRGLSACFCLRLCPYLSLHLG